MRQIRIGISGWRYPPWRDDFYPEGLTQRRELEYASRQVNTIQINGTFYSLQKPESFRAWHDQTPEDFVFSIKGNRYLTHITRLSEPKAPLANFFSSGVLELGKKLGPFLWQFPPSFRYDHDRLERFFDLLPRTTGEAVRLARSHDRKIKGQSSPAGETTTRLSHAIEIRHQSFENQEFIKLLRGHEIAVVVADTARKWPLIEDITADFVYIRLHGARKLYESGYTKRALDEWARKIRRWQKGGNPAGTERLTPALKPIRSGRDVFVYFDNDVKTHAPFDAIALGKRVGIHPQSTAVGKNPSS